MTLMRFDPFRQFEQIMEQNFAGTRTPRTVPMTALRRGDTFIVDLDLPGVVEDDVELTVERNVVTIRARRAPARQDGDEVIIDERPYGEFTRQLFLGDRPRRRPDDGRPARRCAAADHPGQRGEQAPPDPARLVRRSAAGGGLHLHGLSPPTRKAS